MEERVLANPTSQVRASNEALFRKILRDAFVSRAPIRHGRETMPLFSRMLFRLIAATCLFAGSLWAAPEVPAETRERLATHLPKLAAKLEARQPVHIAFVGDPLLVIDDKEPRTMIKAFLRKLEEMFFYTGGTYDVYDPAHLEEKRPKITYESRPAGVPDPGVFHLMQEVSTVGLLNDPDLLVLCPGPGDAASGLDLTTLWRSFDKLHALVTDSGAELLTMAPRAFGFQDDSLALRLETRSSSVALEYWAQEKQVAFYDPNPQLFPRAVLFNSEDNAQTIWNAFLRETIDWIQGPHLEQAAIDGRRQQAIGRALFASLTQPPAQPQFGAETRPAESLTVTLLNLTGLPLGGLIVPGAAGQRGGLRFHPEQAASFQVQPPDDPAQTFRGQLPLSLLVISDRRVQWVNVMAPLVSVGLEWLEQSHHNNLGTVPVKARLFPFEGAPERLPYELTFGKQRTRGIATFLNRGPAEIDWAVTLPEDSEERIFQEKLVVHLGEDGALGVIERRLDAIRQFSLSAPVPLQWVGSGKNAVPPANDDPLSVGQPEASLTVEASKEDFTIHVDLRNFEIAAKEGEPSLQLDLTLDARSFDKRQTLGYAGVLLITAGPDDGPAEVSPFARRAHFGNGYARRPLPSGRLARLSTLPNGVRRLTVQMTPGYFYQHPWELGNFNSQLGIGLSLAIAQPGEAPPLRYVLQETPRYPHNAEDLAVVELATKGSKRWCIKWNP